MTDQAPSRARTHVESLLPFLDLRSWDRTLTNNHLVHSPLVLQGEGKRLEALEDEEEKEDGGDPEEKCEAKSPRCEEEDS